MAENSVNSGILEQEIKTLKETLQAQQQLLRELYNDLDEERESSATATSEALSMILRLQGEKATVEMEASQYKRMAEEKMCHAEETLAVFEDLMYQKEMEVAALEFQIQAYRCKLLSMGCSDISVSETKFYEAFGGEMGVPAGSVRRNNSLPPIPLKGSYIKRGSAIERERSLSPLVNLIPRIVGENMDKESSTENADLEKKSENLEVGNFESHWEQIKKLDERVKEIFSCDDFGRGSRSANLDERSRSSVFSQSSCDSKIEHPEDLLRIEEIENSACSSSIQDIFEVPQANEDRKSCGKRKKEQGDFLLEGENRLGKPDEVSGEIVKSHIEDGKNFGRKTLKCTNKEKLKPRGVIVDCHMAHVRPSASASEAEIQQLTRRMEQLENERRRITREDIREEGEDVMKLLKEIREQLNSIQSEITPWRTKNSPPPDDEAVVSLMEAMLHFWL